MPETMPDAGPDPRPDAPAAGFRVEQLSARSGVPVRTIREYQTWRVLHPPVRVGRIGLYDESHVRRLGDIGRLQARGYSIAAIRDLFEAWEHGSELHEVLGVDDAVGFPADEAPLALTPDQVRTVLPGLAAADHLAAACRIGLLVEHGEDYVARSPALMRLVAEAQAAGLGPDDALRLAQAVVEAADRAAVAAAEALARADTPDLERLARRGRTLLTRALATHAVDRVGRHLAAHAVDQPALGELVDAVRIGSAGALPPPDRGARS